MTVSTAFPLYLAHLRRCDRTEATMDVYRSVYRGWLDGPLGQLHLDKLTPKELNAALHPMRSRVPQSAAVATSILNGLIDWAAEEGV